jgi:hypothetical protein
MKKKKLSKGVRLMLIRRISLYIVILFPLALGCGGGKGDEEICHQYQCVPVEELAGNPKAFPEGAKLELVGFPEKIKKNPYGHRDNLEWTEVFKSGQLFYLRGKEGGCYAILIWCKTDNILYPARVQGEWKKKTYGDGGTEIYYLEVASSSLAKGLR